MCEVWNDTIYVKHHKKKVAFLFSAMKYVTGMLKKQGFNVEYSKLDNFDNTRSFNGAVKRMLSKYNVNRIVVSHPVEYRVFEDKRSLENELNIPVEIREDNRFLSSLDKFANRASDKKTTTYRIFLPGDAKEIRYPDER